MASKRGKTQKKESKIFGVGVNDLDMPVYEYKKDGSKWRIVWKCPIYSTWTRMLQRCYSSQWLEKYPTYRGCYVHETWLNFSTFREWMIQQDWEVTSGMKAKHMDKDLLVPGNKQYSPETTILISHSLNLFLENDQGTSSTRVMKGVSKKGNRFQARCNDPFINERVYLGSFDTELEAHCKWKEYKNYLANQYADMIDAGELIDTDQRISKALRSRYEV